MNEPAHTWTVFTKPWRTHSVTGLADLVARLGFDAIEFPLRPGYQVDLENLPTSLGQLVAALADRGLHIASVASTTDRPIFQACARHNIPLIRIMVPVAAAGYVATRDIIRRQLDNLLPLIDEYGVRVGIQPHYDDYIADSSELANLLRDYDPTAVAAIWDAAHDGLARKHPDHALALLWDNLAMVNFKNACYEPVPAPDPDLNPGPDLEPDPAAVPWQVRFVEGPAGLCSWPAAAAYLRAHAYSGPICLPAEYTDESGLETKLARDLAYLRGLLGS